MKRRHLSSHTSYLKRSTATLCLLSIWALQIPQASASYERVVTWSDQSSLDLSAALKSQYASKGNLLDPVIGESALDVAIGDADSRVNPIFHVPPQMKATVAFWLKMYTTYTTQHVAVFDSRHPELVYEILDFRDLAHTARNQVVYEILRERKIRATLSAYNAAFRHLTAVHGRTAGKTPQEKNVLAAMKNLKHHHTFRELAQNLRTQTGQRDNVMKGLLAAEVYFPKMESLFTNFGLPPELTRLTLVESSFDLSAYSRSGAQGIWQFMPAPGHKLMVIDEQRGIDERLSPLKSTVAAAQMLLESHQRFHNWALSITSYNHGLKGLPKMAHENQPEAFGKISRLFNACDRNSPLGWAGRNYYAEFLAMVHAEAYRHLFYGDLPPTAVNPVAFKRIEKAGSLFSLAMQNGISIQALRSANPDVRDMNRKLPIGFLVAFPGDADDLALLSSSPKIQKRSRSAGVFHASRKTKKA